MSTSSNIEFLPINKISYNDPMWPKICGGARFNVIGVVISVGRIQEIPTKNNTLLPKRSIILGDSSGKTVVWTVWGGDTKENYDNNPVIALRKVSFSVQYHNLATSWYSIIQKNPDLPEAHHLREWYDTVGRYSVGKNKIESCITLLEAESYNPEVGGIPYNFSQLGVITLLKSTEAIYKACAQCKKKLEHQQNPETICKKCNNKICNNYTCGLKLEAAISDSTGERNVVAFGESAETMLGKDIQEIAQLFENNKFQYAQIFEKTVYKTLIFDFCTKKTIYEGQPRLETSVQCCYPFDYTDANAILLKKINKMTGVQG